MSNYSYDAEMADRNNYTLLLEISFLLTSTTISWYFDAEKSAACLYVMLFTTRNKDVILKVQSLLKEKLTVILSAGIIINSVQ